MYPKAQVGDDAIDLKEVDQNAGARRRGRPSKKEAGDLSRRIVEAAARQFLEAGYQATSMDAIAAETGSSKRTLYARFPSKLHLFEAAITQHSMLDHAELRKFENRPGSVAATLEEFAVWLGRRTTHMRNVAFFRILAAEAHRHLELQEFYERNVVKPIVETVGRIFEIGMARGEIADADSRFLAEQFLEAVCAREMRRRIYGQTSAGETRESRERIRSAVRLFLQGAEQH
ncbi:TetR/AcrR family transcriptional regulator [Aureimonas sp. ME7]|uniref:TetR/AcrR family transcriptional regulator n=1 Tax=Aureimonas sp. ME7 TaxID=2744252 RepID=UPI0015F3BCE5|nr:TetR/AcrR family transcriptional regulator [Aureimonas sp. ME7]